MLKKSIYSWEALLCDAIGEDAAMRIIFHEGKRLGRIRDKINTANKFGLLRAFSGKDSFCTKSGGAS